MGNEVDLQRPFADVYKALDLKTQRKAMRSAMRKEGNRVKKVAVSTLHSKAIGPEFGQRYLCEDIPEPIWFRFHGNCQAIRQERNP